MKIVNLLGQGMQSVSVSPGSEYFPGGQSWHELPSTRYCPAPHTSLLASLETVLDAVDDAVAEGVADGLHPVRSSVEVYPSGQSEHFSPPMEYFPSSHSSQLSIVLDPSILFVLPSERQCSTFSKNFTSDKMR